MLLSMLIVTLLVLFAVQEYSNYISDRSHLADELDEIAKTQDHALTSALWEYNNELIDNLLKNLASHPAFLFAEIKGTTGDAIASYRSPIHPVDLKTQPDLIVTQELIYDDGNILERVGFLTIGFHTETLFDQLLENLTRRFWIIAITALVMSFSVFLITRKIIGLPLEHLKSTIENEDVRYVEWGSDDQLGDVIKAYNALQRRDEEASRKIHEYQNHLESMVKDRTAELKEKQEYLRVAMDNIPGAMFMVDKDLSIVLANDQYQELFNFPDGMVQTGRPIVDMLVYQAQRGDFGPGNVLQHISKVAKKFTDGKKHLIERNIKPDRYLEISLGPTPMGGAVAVATDVTARKVTDNILREALAITNSSIDYASRIQQSVLPNPHILDAVISDYFILWEPRDVVGGDLYWVGPWGNGCLILIGDCTGHGVPGAFMTLIAIGALERAISEIDGGEIGKLISRMHQLIQVTLSQHYEGGKSDDGIEIGACYYVPEEPHLKYAGARFDLFMHENDEIKIIKGTKKGMGYRGIPYTQQYDEILVELSHGQNLYMTSDGIIDQIGGERKRMFGKKRLSRILLQIQDLPMEEQKDRILEALLEYQGEENRRDDISMIGFKVF